MNYHCRATFGPNCSYVMLSRPFSKVFYEIFWPISENPKITPDFGLDPKSKSLTPRAFRKPQISGIWGRVTPVGTPGRANKHPGLPKLRNLYQMAN